LIFEPRGAWQILSKSGLSARRTRAEALCAEATNAEHTIWLRGQDSNLQPIDYTYLTVSNKGGLYLCLIIKMI